MVSISFDYFLSRQLITLIALYYSCFFLVLTLAGPFLLLRKKARAGFWQKLGFVPRQIRSNSNLKGAVWFHAVSVGEFNAILPLIRAFHERFPLLPVVVSTTTYTGQALAQQHVAKFAQVIYFPYDLPTAAAWLDALRPTMVVIAETEIWPGFAGQCRKRGIKLLVVNGRMSPRSFKSYRRWRFFFGPVLRCFDEIGVQSQEEVERYVACGAAEKTVRVLGNLKLDIAPAPAERAAALRRELNLGAASAVSRAGQWEIVENREKSEKSENREKSEKSENRAQVEKYWKSEKPEKPEQSEKPEFLEQLEIAEKTGRAEKAGGENQRTGNRQDEQVIIIGGSTHEGEEAALLKAYGRLLDGSQGQALGSGPAQVQPNPEDFKLILVPRHPERFDHVAALVDQAGFTVRRYSRGERFEPTGNNREVYLLDVIGKLFDFYSIASLAFVGGTIAPVGGHNLMEPYAYGVPAVCGPHIEKTRDSARALVACGALFLEKDGDAVCDAIISLARDQQRRHAAGLAGKQLLEASQGALGKALDMLAEHLADNSARQSRLTVSSR